MAENRAIHNLPEVSPSQISSLVGFDLFWVLIVAVFDVIVCFDCRGFGMWVDSVF